MAADVRGKLRMTCFVSYWMKGAHIFQREWMGFVLIFRI